MEAVPVGSVVRGGWFPQIIDIGLIRFIWKFSTQIDRSAIIDRTDVAPYTASDIWNETGESQFASRLTKAENHPQDLSKSNSEGNSYLSNDWVSSHPTTILKPTLRTNGNVIFFPRFSSSSSLSISSSSSFYFSLPFVVSLCVCVCVWVSEREKEREGLCRCRFFYLDWFWTVERSVWMGGCSVNVTCFFNFCFVSFCFLFLFEENGWI